MSRRTGEPDESASRDNPESDPVEVARAIALRQLTLGPRSRAQLAQAMSKRNVPDDVAEVVLNRFEEIGLINDAEFARTVVRSQQAERGLAKRALRFELTKRGVGDDDMRTALEDVSAEDELASARHLVAKKLRSMSGLERDVQIRRLAGMLARKGYGPGTAMSVIREVLFQHDAEAFQELPEL